MYAITPKERLQQYARYKFGTMKAMEVHCGLVNGQIGNNSGPNVSTIQKILEACPELNPDWIILGVGPMERSLDLPNKKEGQNHEHDQGQMQASENTTIYHVNIPNKGDEPMVTLPASVLKSLQQQLEQKDTQISQLLKLMEKLK